MKNIWDNFKLSIIFGLVCLTLAFFWGLNHGVDAGLSQAFNIFFITVILAVLEISLSIDNAVYNATVLKHWNPFWQKLFLTVGILVAVFGMRLVFPIVIVSSTTEMSFIESFTLALNSPTEYSKHLLASHTLVASFGGMFLLLVFLNFFFDNEKDVNWLGPLEKVGEVLGKTFGWFTPYMFAFIVLAALIVTTMSDAILSSQIFKGGLVGIASYFGVQTLGSIIEMFTGDTEEESEANGQVATGTVKAGIGGFLYLELVDASFSVDGVAGAFAVTTDIIVIMLGLAIGAMVVRCLTVYLVKKGTLDTYRYLEHGAMYAIAALALIMLSSPFIHLPEVAVGLISIAFIILAVFSSIRENKKESSSDNGTLAA